MAYCSNGHFQTFSPVTLYRGTVPKKQNNPGDGILRISLIEKEVEFYKRISLKNQPEKRISLKNQPEKRISLKNQPN
jgi:hypothetical protein